MKLGRLLLRLSVGGFFIGHGTQKLFGWFGGYGLDGTGQFFEQLGLRPGKRHATAAGLAETGGGALLVAGLATPAAASVLTATMLTAIHRVHGSKGPWATNGGYEYNVVLIAAVLALAEVGPGDVSLDAALGIEREGPFWALAALAAGAIGAAGAHLVAEGAPEPEVEPLPDPEGWSDPDTAPAPAATAEPEASSPPQTESHADSPQVTPDPSAPTVVDTPVPSPPEE